MSTLGPIYASLAVPTSAAPSATCLQWTADGQLILVTKNAVHILTPDAAVAPDPTNAVKSALPLENNDPTSEAPRTFGLFKTMIEFDRAAAHVWPLMSQEWSTVVLGSLDTSLRVVTASPSQMIGTPRCVLAVLNSNLEASLYQAAKNHLRGEWSKVQDITAYLHDLVADEPLSTTVKTLNVQVSTIAWSPQASFGVVPAPTFDGSLLAVATRAGVVRFFRFNSDSYGHAGRAEQLDLVAVGDSWITHMAWTPWVPCGLESCQALLACACADGSIRLIMVSQHLKRVTASGGLAGDYSMIAVFQKEPSVSVKPEDVRGITALRWICQANSKPLALVYCSPGAVHLLAAPGGAAAWTGERTFALRTQRLSTDSCALHPAVGLEYVPAQDLLVVGLYDGSIHVIRTVSSSPALDGSDELADGETIPDFASERLSRRVRAVFTRAETEAPVARPQDKGKIRITPKDANRTSGLASFDGGSTLLWLHESCRPSDFSYKHDARHISRLVVAQLWERDADADMLARLRRLYTNAPEPGHVSISLLRPYLLHLRRNGKVAELAPALLELFALPADNTAIDVIVPAISEQMDEDARKAFRGSLAAHLLGWPALSALRLRLATATYAQQQLPANSPIRSQIGECILVLINALTYHTLLTLIRHLAAVVFLLTSQDVPFAMRVAVQSMFPGCPARLTLEASELMRGLPNAVTDDSQPATPPPPPPVPLGGFEERCPACAAEVKLANLIDAECLNGHVWGRCSITSFVLATPKLRTCVGCGRKAFLPPSACNMDVPEFLPEGARGWFSRELLEAVTRCLLCGNGFVTLV